MQYGCCGHTAQYSKSSSEYGICCGPHNTLAAVHTGMVAATGIEAVGWSSKYKIHLVDGADTTAITMASEDERL